MPSLIGALKITLGLETAAFEKGARRSKAEIDALGTRAEKMGFAVGRAGKALIGLAGIFAGSALLGGLKDLVTSSLEAAASLGEQAQQLGVTTRTLQEYRYAATQVGISQEEMDKGLSELTKRLGQAAAGAARPTKALETLGISLRDSNGRIREAGDMIPLIAEALSKIPDPATRAALEVELFGKAGQRMGSLLEGGAKGVNGLRDAAHQMGLVLDDRLINNADKAADNLSTLHQVLSMRITAFVAENAGAIDHLATSLLNFATRALNAYTEWKKLTDLTERQGKLYAAADKYLANRADLSDAERARASAGARAIINRRLGLQPDGSNGFGPLFQLRRVTPLPGKLIGDSFGLTSEQGLGGFEPGKFTGGLALIGAELGKLTSGVDAFTEAFSSAGDEGSDAADQITASAEGLAQALAMINADAEMAGQALVDRFSQAEQAIADVRERAVDSLTNGITAAIMEAENLGDVFRNVANQIIADLIRIAVQRSIVEPLANALFGGSSGGGGLLGGLIHGLFGFADGTLNAPRGLAVVGERGPELVNFSGGEQVFNRQMLGAMGGGGDTYIFKGNMMTPEFWAQIQRGHVAAMQGGSDLAQRNLAYRQSRSLA